MKQKTIYVKIEQKDEKSNCYIDMNKIKKDVEEIKESYKEVIEFLKDFGTDKILTLEEFSKNYIPVKIEYDGRGNTIYDSDIKKALVNDGIIELVSKGDFLGGYYKVKDYFKVVKGFYKGESLI